MIDYRTVAMIALIELAVLTILIGVYLGRAWWTLRVREQRKRHYSEARMVLSRFAASGRETMEQDDLAIIGRLSRTHQFALFSQVASILSASDRRFAGRIAGRLGLLDIAARMSRSRRWWKRLQAVRFLASLGETSIKPDRFFDDPRLEVRAQAAEWAGDLGNPRLIPPLLSLLGDPAGLCRYTVQDALQRIGAPVAGPLRTHLDVVRSDTELLAALVVAERIAEGSLLDPILRVSHHELAAVRTLAARTLAAIGGDAALERLKKMAGDPEGEVRTAAVAGMATLGGAACAGVISRHLSDSYWNARREAGLALLGMGAPGRVLLRAQTRSADRFARDMATLVLELPSGGTSA